MKRPNPLHPHHGVVHCIDPSSQARGNWGEVKLRRLFEMAGMSENIDFDEQTTLSDGKRPTLWSVCPVVG